MGTIQLHESCVGTSDYFFVSNLREASTKMENGGVVMQRAVVLTSDMYRISGHNWLE